MPNEDPSHAPGSPGECRTANASITGESALQVQGERPALGYILVEGTKDTVSKGSSGGQRVGSRCWWRHTGIYDAYGLCSIQVARGLGIKRCTSLSSIRVHGCNEKNQHQKAPQTVQSALFPVSVKQQVLLFQQTTIGIIL